MKQLLALFQETIEIFDRAGFAFPGKEAEDILCAFFSISKGELFAVPLKEVEEASLPLFFQALKRRLLGEPLEYIIGKIEFYHCRFNLTQDVLIPRQETEILVDKVVSFLKEESCEGKVLLDLCAGSGCIGISIKNALPLLEVCLSDVSVEAVEVARENARTNGVSVAFFCGDFLNPLKGQKFDYVVCNPPYISEEEFYSLDKSVRDFEPRIALVGGESGFKFYEQLASELPLYLQRGARVWLEIGYNQGKGVKKLFERAPWKKGVLENDWSGHSRFFFLENE